MTYSNDYVCKLCVQAKIGFYLHIFSISHENRSIFYDFMTTILPTIINYYVYSTLLKSSNTYCNVTQMFNCF